ncbi:MAG: bifunctional phosphoribosylaminoimidazolecarboxamide formyltransferase/IMP cyclohydrolase [Gemmatimonadetes bacterium GWC2_71_10]|nr:MAG: bifunctional phosphoribosylaminoimidazolecarboxamide formyltransferase/IMP cyclohydrolase [Gemmatimonadetes bacterium GWC2_71_10]
MPRALVSVSDKRGAAEFAGGLVSLGWEILSTGGTAQTLRDNSVAVTPVERVTGFPEMMDGRVKTLHPAIHGGILARRNEPGDMESLAKHGFGTIDLVAVNLYPFRETIARPGVSLGEAIEQIDIGGPSMLRSAAKNHEHVVVIVDPMDYRPVLDALRRGGVSATLRRELAAKAFMHTAGYDGAIAAYLAGGGGANELPPALVLVLERNLALRYGENPHQKAAFYTTGEPGGLATLSQLGGKELSFNNLLDIDAALAAVSAFEREVACAIVKHTTPCGIAVATNATEAFTRARATDPVSAFGSVIGFNTVVTEETAAALGDLFVEAVVAPRFHTDAVTRLRLKKNLRIVEVPRADDDSALDFKRVRSGFLVQSRLRFDSHETDWKVATKRAPDDAELGDLRFAWAAVMSVKSNAILLAKHRAAIGIGAGQMSRVDSSMLAVHKAKQAGHDVKGAVLASDAFFPFRDGVDAAADAGVRAIIQPGGSVRDAEVIDAANEHGIAMIMTGVRQFRH